jgi:hypothetical protein
VTAAEFDAVDECVRAHRQVGTVADRVEIRERGVPPEVAGCVDGADRDSGSAIEVQ